MIRSKFDPEARRLRRAFLLPALFVCLAATSGADQFSTASVNGRLDHPDIREASGLARSGKSADRLWTINDSGSRPMLFAVGLDGSLQGSARVRSARNFDWEDLAAFHYNGRDWLLIADIGDNFAIRRYVTLYIVEEPESPSDTDVVREIRLAFPDGPQDCEAVAVDVASDRVLLLSKRTIPAVLYSVPLVPPTSDEPVLAERLGPVASIPQPTARDLERAAPTMSWHWQPTAMDISADGRQAAILTYRAVYVFGRKKGELWIDTLQRKPLRLDLDGARLAESVAFSGDGDSIFVTLEGRSPPLLQFQRTGPVEE